MQITLHTTGVWGQFSVWFRRQPAGFSLDYLVISPSRKFRCCVLPPRILTPNLYLLYRDNKWDAEQKPVLSPVSFWNRNDLITALQWSQWQLHLPQGQKCTSDSFHSPHYLMCPPYSLLQAGQQRLSQPPPENTHQYFIWISNISPQQLSDLMTRGSLINSRTLFQVCVVDIE